MAREVLVVQTGTANIASVLAGLGRVGARPVLVNDPDRLLAADRVVLPGVGALAAAMDRLESDGLTGVLRSRVDEGRPTLAICLGLQLLCVDQRREPRGRGAGRDGRRRQPFFPTSRCRRWAGTGSSPDRNAVT